ncbi:hypothetical protein [Desulfonispora thiosulfatigenes]
MPLTILSRCQRFDFRKIGTEEIKTHLEEIVKETQIEITESALLTIARKADGGMRDAISLLDQCIAFAGNEIIDSDVETVLGTLSEEQIINISDALIEQEPGKAIIYLNDYLQSGKDIKQIIRDLLEHFRNIMLLKVSSQDDLVALSAEMLPKIKQQASSLSLKYIGVIVTKLTEVEKELRWTSQPQILVEASLIDIILRSSSFNEPEVRVVRENVIPRTHSPQGTNIASSEEKGSRSSEMNQQTEQKQVRIVRKSPQLQEIKKMWPQVLESVKKQKVTTHAFLMMGEPFDLTEDVLILTFEKTYKFHSDRINQPDNKQLVQKSIEDILGMKVSINCILEGEITTKEEISTKSDIDKAIEIFGKDIVEIKD